MIILNVTLYVLIIVFVHDSFAKKFETKLLSLEMCKLPESHYDKENVIFMALSSKRVDRKTSTVSSNYTIYKRIGPIIFNFRAYQLQRNLVKDLEYKLEKLDCKHEDIVKILEVFQLDLDSECFLTPGVYYVSNIKVDQIGEVMSKSVMTTGKYAYDMEMSTKDGVILCVNIALEYVR